MLLPKRGPARRTVALVLLFAVVGILVVATFAVGAKQKPRNDPNDKRNLRLGEINGANPVNDCLSHHRSEGMVDTVILYPIAPEQFKLGQRSPIQVQIINPWKQELRNVTLKARLLGEPIMAVEGKQSEADLQQDIHHQFQWTLGPRDSQQNRKRFEFTIPPTAEGVTASVIIHPSLENTPFASPPPTSGVGMLDFRDQYTVAFAETGSWFYPHYENGNANRYALHRNNSFTTTGGGSNWVDIIHTEGRSERTNVTVFVNITVASGAGGKEYEIPVPVEKLAKYTSQTVDVMVTPFRKGFQDIEFSVRAGAYYKHQDRSTPTLDFYNRYQTLNQTEDRLTASSIIPRRHLVVGDEYKGSALGVATVSVQTEDFRLILGEVSGFAAASLLLPSLLLGGTYGKASRRFFNTMLGGAKRRVMFHNLLSLGLSLVAVIHILLFMLEIRYTVLMGVLWGGVGALSLLVLGLTGYYQVPLIQRHGFNWWRYSHLVFGIIVVVSVAYHMIADGADFFFIKEQLPQWVNDINSAQK